MNKIQVPARLNSQKQVRLLYRFNITCNWSGSNAQGCTVFFNEWNSRGLNRRVSYARPMRKRKIRFPAPRRRAILIRSPSVWAEEFRNLCRPEVGIPTGTTGRSGTVSSSSAEPCSPRRSELDTGARAFAGRSEKSNGTRPRDDGSRFVRLKTAAKRRENKKKKNVWSSSSADRNTVVRFGDD